MNYSAPFLGCFYSICVLTIVRKLCRRRLGNWVVTDILHETFLYGCSSRRSRSYVYSFTSNCIIFLTRLWIVVLNKRVRHLTTCAIKNYNFKCHILTLFIMYITFSIFMMRKYDIHSIEIKQYQLLFHLLFLFKIDSKIQILDFKI